MNKDILFERVYNFTLGVELGAADHPDDPGGVTVDGISQKYNEDMDVANSTVAERTERARSKYWESPKIHLLHPMWALVVFDTGFHHGPRDAIRMFQEMARIKVDGDIGPQTIAAAARCRSEYHLGMYLAKRLGVLEEKPHKGPFINGWRIRLFRLFAEARTLL